MLTRVFKKVEYRFGPAWFGNTLGTIRNREWKLFHDECKKIFSISDPQTQSKPAKMLKRDRLTVLGNTDVGSLAKDVSNYFGESTDTFKEMPSAEAVKLAPEIYKILKKVELDVNTYYESYFQPYWIKIQRTTPGKTTAASSFGWHIDDNPLELMKIFVYLNDVSESNGAFRAFAWKHSRRILLKGFRSNGEETRIKAQPLADKYLKRHPKSLKVLEGVMGTVLAFDNNLVHKGTAPRVGFRHAIQIPIYPSKVPLTLEMVKLSLLSPQARDYPLNPEVNDFGY